MLDDNVSCHRYNKRASWDGCISHPFPAYLLSYILCYIILNHYYYCAVQEGRPADRNASDKEALAAKVAAKAEAKAAAEAAEAAAGGTVVRKPKPKKEAALDDLLDAGLGPVKKKGGKK